MNKIKVTGAEARDLAYDAQYKRTIDHSRWSYRVEYVGFVQGKWYMWTMSCPATEYQYEDDPPEVELTEVHSVEKMMKVWEPVL